MLSVTKNAYHDFFVTLSISAAKSWGHEKIVVRIFRDIPKEIYIARESCF